MLFDNPATNKPKLSVKNSEELQCVCINVGGQTYKP